MYTIPTPLVNTIEPASDAYFGVRLSSCVFLLSSVIFLNLFNNFHMFNKIEQFGSTTVAGHFDPIDRQYVDNWLIHFQAIYKHVQDSIMIIITKSQS